MYDIFQALNCVVSNFSSFFLRFQRKSTYSFFAVDFLVLFNNAHFHFYFSWEFMIMWLNKIISLNKQRFYKKIVTCIIIFIICILTNFGFVKILCFPFYENFIKFVLLFVMGKNIGKYYRYSQSRLSKFSLKIPVSLSSDPQKSSDIKLTTTSVPSVTDKNQNNYVLYYQNTIHNDATITNNDDIQSCETARKINYSIPTISTPNHHKPRIATT